MPLAMSDHKTTGNNTTISTAARASVPGTLGTRASQLVAPYSTPAPGLKVPRLCIPHPGSLQWGPFPGAAHPELTSPSDSALIACDELQRLRCGCEWTMSYSTLGYDICNLAGVREAEGAHPKNDSSSMQPSFRARTA